MISCKHSSRTCKQTCVFADRLPRNYFYGFTADVATVTFLPRLSRLLSRVISISFALQEYRTNFEEISGGNRYQKQIKLLYFGRNCNRHNGTRYDRKFESTLAGVLPRRQTGSDAQRTNSQISQHILRHMPSRTQFQVNFAYKFHINTKNFKAIYFQSSDNYIQYLSAADIGTFIHLFVRCAILLAMTTLVWKENIYILQGYQKIQRRRHHILGARSFALKFCFRKPRTAC